MTHRFAPLLIALLLSALPHSTFANEDTPEAHGEGEEAAKPESKIVALLPLHVPTLEGRRVVKYTIVGISIEAAPAVDTEAIKLAAPRLNDALLAEAYLYAKDNETFDVETLRAQLKAAVETILGPGQITGLYFAGLHDMNM